MRKMTKRAAVIATGAVIAVTGSTAAFAYAAGWFKGDTAVTATTSAIANVHATIVVANNAANHLYPGRSVPVSASTISNPNDFAVQINSIGNISSISGAPNCGGNEAQLTFSEMPSGTTVPAHTTSANVPLGKVTMGVTADPACAGATLTVNAALTGEISS
jgi:hypothetical protein